jgi:N-acetyl-gamma-glutamyl-phosphate reductase
MKDSLNVAIAGATGFVGIELIKILLKHKKVKILSLCATKSVGKNINIFDKKLKNKNLPKISLVKDLNWNKINIIFTALPNGEAQKIAKKIPAKVKLIDLSGDFRLRKSEDYKKWYGLNHRCKELINKSHYSIPEFSKKKIKNYNIISCPGCYPTSAQIPLIPLIQKKMINVKNIIIDSKSGYSGGGRDVKKKFKCDILNSVSAYGVGDHKHIVEIDQELSKRSHLKVNVTFTPHLIPMFRGILSTIYIESTGKIDAIKVYKFLKKYHRNNFFIKFAKFNIPINTDSVINTNFCKISVCKNREKNKIIIISVIDNLIKGASGQAVQNMNIAFNLKESMGLT